MSHTHDPILFLPPFLFHTHIAEIGVLQGVIPRILFGVRRNCLGREKEREKAGKRGRGGLECLLKTAGPHTELKQEIPASGGRGGFGAAKGS